MKYFFPTVSKIYSTETPNDALLVARHLCEVLPASVRDAEGRSWLVAEGDESITWEANDESALSDNCEGTLRVTGTVRGGRMSARRLVHIPGHGDFQVAEVRCRISP